MKCQSIIHKISFLSVLLLAWPAGARMTLEVPTSAVVRYVDSSEPLKAENGRIEDFDLSQPVWITSDGNLPVLLVPVDSYSGKITISPPKVEKIERRIAQEVVDSSLADILPRVAEIQELISHKRLQEAEAKLGYLQQTYPRVAFLNFLKASILYLRSEKSEAIRILKETLKQHPDFSQGKELLNRLEGP